MTLSAKTVSTIVLNVKPLGDAVMTCAVARALECVGIETKVHVPEFARKFLAIHGAPVADDEFISHAELTIDIGDYLRQDPHVNRIEDNFLIPGDIDRKGFGHLSQWIGKFVAENLELIRLHVDPDDARLDITQSQLERGRSLLEEQVKCPTEKVVLVIPAAGSLNRVISPFVVMELRRRVENVHVVGPLPKGMEASYPEPVSFSLEELPSALAAARVVIAADTGPFHIAAAAKLGVKSDDAQAVGIRVRLDQVILVAGSSNPFTLIYGGLHGSTQHVLPEMTSCPVIPCGAHGYTPAHQHAALQRRVVYTAPGEKSGCIFPAYEQGSIPPCMLLTGMQHLGHLIEKVRALLKQ